MGRVVRCRRVDDVSVLQDDQRVWLKRPAPERVLEVAMRHTMYLVELRARILEELLREFTEGVDLYLSVIRDASDETFSQKEVGVTNLLNPLRASNAGCPVVPHFPHLKDFVHILKKFPHFPHFLDNPFRKMATAAF